jgi:transcriptional antiterminator RfaH
MRLHRGLEIRFPVNGHRSLTHLQGEGLMSRHEQEEETLWFAIYTKPRQEQRAYANLRSLNLETFFPTIREKSYNQFTGKASFLIKPLFLRYIFARFHPGYLLHKVRNTRGVHSVVSFGNKPAEVDSSLIDIIYSRLDQDGFVNIWSEFKAGDEVMVQDGPLRGFTAIFEREMKDSDRVSILLNTLSYQAHLILEKSMLGKIDLDKHMFEKIA